jgi:nucleotide-binding universal stress UspA family protein
MVGEFQFAPQSLESIVESERAELASWIGRANELGASAVETRFLTGSPRDPIVEAAHDDPELDLVVMGTQRRTGSRTC